MPHRSEEHEKTKQQPPYQEEDEEPSSLDDWETAVQGWFAEIMKGRH